MRRLSTVLLAGLLAGCITPPPAPPAPYRAVGQEPGWTLIIDDRDVTFIGQDGSVVREPRPQPIVGPAGQTYRTARIQANIVTAPCTDIMSGQAYPHRVQVEIDGRRFNGCGGL